MNELIKIENQHIDGAEIPAVDARELHKFLGVSTKFNTWIKRRMDECRLLENRDYIWVSQFWETQTSQGKLGVATQKTVVLSIDSAKHIAMMERTDKGFEAREYFIECEKQLKETLSSKDSLLLGIFKAEGDIAKAEAINRYETGYVRPLENKVEEQAEIITQQAPKVTYYDLVLQSEDLMNISQIAKDFEITAQKLNKILPCIGKSGRSVLHEEGIQYKDKSGIWLLYAKHLNNQYAQTVTNAYEANGKTHTKLHLKWTQKGRLFIYELLKSKGILPVVEKEVK